MHKEFQVCTRKSVYLTFSSRRSSICKSPPPLGGSHFLLCQHTSTKDIAGQSARDKLQCEIVKGHLFSLFRPFGSSPLGNHTGQAHLSFELKAHIYTFKFEWVIAPLAYLTGSDFVKYNLSAEEIYYFYFSFYFLVYWLRELL